MLNCLTLYPLSFFKIKEYYIGSHLYLEDLENVNVI
jgi:hypothetical protein